MTESKALSIQNATVIRGTQRALDDVSIEVAEGSFHCIIGPNGAGKSTLLGLLAGDFESTAVTLTGQSLISMNLADRARKRAVVRPGTPHEFGFSVAEFIELCKPQDGHTETRINTLDILIQCDLLELANRPITQLSSGQLARVHIAAALRQHTPIVLADEPESTLDPHARKRIWQLLARANKTIVLATHSLDLVMQFATHVTAITHGRVTFSEPRGNFSLANLEQIFD